MAIAPRLLAFLMPIMVTALLSTAAPARSADAEDFRALQALDARLLAIGYKLTVANAPFCADRQYQLGMQLHDIAQYGDKATARAAFGFDGDISVLALVPRGPAAQAGIRVNDSPVLLDGKPFIPALDEKGPSQGRLSEVQTAIEQRVTGPEARFTLLRGEERFEAVVTPVIACASRFEIVPSDEFRAFADGRLVSVTSRLAEYASNDAELAAVVAHELAHNLLRHRQRLNDAGINRQLILNFGRSARLTRESEEEADRLSVWLITNAGYNPGAAIRFWERYGREHGEGLISSSTHYRWKKRVKFFVEEKAKIAAATRGPEGYAPPLLAAVPVLE